MKSLPSSCPDIRNVEQANGEENASQLEIFSRQIDEMFSKVDELEQRVNAVEQYYANADNKKSNLAKCNSILKDKVKEKQLVAIEKQQRDASQREAAAEKRMIELMRLFAVIFHQITQHKWAWPFMEPVDVVGLNLHDYYKVIEKPMDFGSIRKKMEAKDGTGYKNVREIYADVRLVFKNAMKYNDERDDVHVMAKTLLEKFEERWLLLLPKVVEEEKRRVEEEAATQLAMKQAQETSHSNMTRNLSNELSEIEIHLENLREMVVHHCRKFSTDDKKKLWAGLNLLPPEDLIKALEIVAENNPSFQPAVQEVELDLNAQSELTLWRLKVFVQDVLRGRNSAGVGGDNKENLNKKNKNIIARHNSNKNNSKRRREICDALARTSAKKTKKIHVIP